MSNTDGGGDVGQISAGKGKKEVFFFFFYKSFLQKMCKRNWKTIQSSFRELYEAISLFLPG